ncbi:conjugative transposon protein TraM [Paraflavitalea sp. CAU 1676]|uniref:conjugative transposon protein TraM n=1 Tax=Paraflavitalea sp. CAU 1676 TaxID=3032598 RepID=UPI0023DBC571|nr:conjugative transposon protein TraM [Paraflavitalea sp. CAU 1676]MDF2191373.1 conjugative transposon protein TraM [Paraflavitalea sp. CAU 1676]
MKPTAKKMNKFVVLAILFLVPILVILLLYTQFSAPAENVTSDSTQVSNFDKTVPQPKIKNREKTKLELYMKAKQDSAAEKKDTQVAKVPQFFNPGPPERDYAYPSDKPKKASLADQERRVNDQLNQIMQQLEASGQSTPNNNLPADRLRSERSADIERLEQMARALQESNAQPDPEMMRLNEMLDKIIRIKEPLATTDLPNAQNNDSSLQARTVSRTPGPKTNNENGFYGLSERPITISRQKAAIRAIVHGDQTIVSGSTVLLRLLEPIYVDQTEIPAQTLVEGKCTISNERILVSIGRVGTRGTFFPVDLRVYDIHGTEGISAPGAITRDEAKNAAARSIQSIGIGSLDPGLAGQAVSAGIQGAKSLFTRKATMVRATAKAGHLVYLQ